MNIIEKIKRHLDKDYEINRLRIKRSSDSY